MGEKGKNNSVKSSLKIMNHKHKDMIVKLLLDGRSVRYVSKLLKDMFPNDKNMHVTSQTLQAFRKEQLDIDGDVLKGIKRASKERTDRIDNAKIHNKVKNLPSYREKLEEAAGMHLDVRKSLIQIDALLKERLEQFFNNAQEGNNTREDEKLLQGYFDRYFVMIDKWAKYIDKVADQRIEHNINITVINEQMSLLRSAVVNVLQRLDQSLSTVFIEELDKEMNKLSYGNKTQPIEKIHGEVELLGEIIDE
jgi:hypothetical protein